LLFPGNRTIRKRNSQHFLARTTSRAVITYQ
jgi:hypothetical protein